MTTRSRASTSRIAGSDRPAAEGAEPAAVRGRHVVDRALDYAALEATGLRAADIARRRRRSKAHVSILLRLGRALRGCTAEEVAAFRSPRITWKLAQQLVRTSTADDVLRHRLRQALGGFSRLNVDRRRQRTGRMSPVDPLRVQSGTYVWQWDPAWAERDPAGYVDAYHAFLARMHRDLIARLHAPPSVGDGGQPALSGQSLRQLTARLAMRSTTSTPPGRTPAQRAALDRLRALETILTDRQEPDAHEEGEPA